MPASVTESSSCIEETIRSSLGIGGKDSLHKQILSASQKVLLHKIDFEPAQKSASHQLDTLREKYSSLNPSKGLAAKAEHNATERMTQNQEDGSGGLPPPRVTLYPPEKVKMEWPRVMRIGAGLHNMGNTCFLNSTLQCLTYTAPLVNYLLTEDHANKCHVAGFCMICELQRHVRRCFEQGGGVIKPQVILQKLRMIAKNMHFGRQEDAHEFLRHVVDAMQKSCLNGYQKLDRFSKETTVVNQIFGGFLRSQVVCMYCKGQSNTYDPFLDISLDIKNSPSIERAFEKYVEVENLDTDNAYNCLKCKKKVPAQKRFSVHKEPNILTVQLKRFAGFFGGKINRHIQFRERFNLRPYMSNKQGEPIIYQLYAVLVHSGFSCTSGHYYCYVKGSNHSWYCMNDSSVHQVGLQRVMSAEAYLLFYVRQRRTIQHNTDHVKAAQVPTKSPGFKAEMKNSLANGPIGKANSEKNASVGRKNTAQTTVRSVPPSQPLKISPVKTASPGIKSPPMRSPPSIVTPTNPLKSAPTVQGLSTEKKNSFKPTTIPNINHRDKVSFELKQKQDPSSTNKVSSEKPKIVMRIKNGKVSYNSISPTGEKLKPSFSAVGKANVMKRLVEYDVDDEESMESDQDADKSKQNKNESATSTIGTIPKKTNDAKVEMKPVVDNGAKKMTGNVATKAKSNGIGSATSPKDFVSKVKSASNGLFEPVLDSCLNATTEVPGAYGPLNKASISSKQPDSADLHHSPSKDPRILRKSLSLDTSLSVKVTSPESGKANSTTKWQVFDQEAKSPSLASSNGSVNSTTAGWQMYDDSKRRNPLLPDAQHPGWKVISPGKTPHTFSTVADALMPDMNIRKPSKFTAFGKFKSKDDSYLQSSTSTGSIESMKKELFSTNKAAIGDVKKLSDSSPQVHGSTVESKGEKLADVSKVEKLEDIKQVVTNGHPESSASSVSSEKKKKKKKKRKHKDYEKAEPETSTVSTENEDTEPPRKKKKKKHKHSPESKEENGLRGNASQSSNGGLETVSEEKCPQNKQQSEEKIKAEPEEELEEGEIEWVERTKESIEEEEKVKPKVPTQQWDQHVKDDKKPASHNQDRGDSSWDGVRRSKQNTVHDLERAGRKAYGTAVAGWGGGVSELDEWRRRERLQAGASHDDWHHDYEHQLDMGRTKKVKQRYSDEGPRYNHNAFQRHYDHHHGKQGGGGPDRRKSWHHMDHGGGRGNHHGNNKWGGYGGGGKQGWKHQHQQRKGGWNQQQHYRHH